MTALLQKDFSALQWQTDSERGVRSDTLGLYIHLPYCRTKCTYCAFVSAPPQTEEEMDAYTQAIRLHLIAGAKQVNGRSISTVFFGGGTPSLLGKDRLSILLHTIHENYNIMGDAEITLEANPESATLDLMQTLFSLGVNRISMGAQSFDEAELKRIGRVHQVEDIPNAVNDVKKAGIQNVSIDLIYGLPDQSYQKWQDTVKRALDCEVSHLSAYGLTYEDGTLLHRQMTNGTVTPLPDDTYVEMYHYLQSELSKNNFEQYEISNWSKPGYECRHNLIYWNRDEYLAFGVSAHGMVDGYRYHIHPAPKRYLSYFQNAADQPYLEMDIALEKRKLTPKEAAEDFIIFGLRLSNGIHIPSFASRFGYSPFDRWGEEITKFIHRGLLEQKDGYVRLTRNAYLISNEVMQAFID